MELLYKMLSSEDWTNKESLPKEIYYQAEYTAISVNPQTKPDGDYIAICLYIKGHKISENLIKVKSTGYCKPETMARCPECDFDFKVTLTNT